ncbi:MULTISPECIES: trimeric intracellular cation channel family protein [unclassified Desulfurobacterium]|uniref:trimeric intracellular cation channel family protein n=1 Tax=unclassified Desulfurobacterium TaxID=2639089 RepID=UPI0003B45702|nr:MULTISPECIES: trimeric intracellular cation channel family protein [unclassified Desulfurobacterium]
MTLFDFFNITGLLAFAVSGVYKGAGKELDILGVSVLGFLTALGGGIMRDVIVNRIPVALTGYGDVSFAIGGIALGIFLYRVFKIDISSKTIVKIFDAIGLAAFTVTGALVGIKAGLNVVGVIIVAVLTGTGGGMTSDILIGEVPSILREDVYATCAMFGGLLLFVLTRVSIPLQIATFTTLIFTLSFRLLAIFKNWHLPRF